MSAIFDPTEVAHGCRPLALLLTNRRPPMRYKEDNEVPQHEIRSPSDVSQTHLVSSLFWPSAGQPRDGWCNPFQQFTAQRRCHTEMSRKVPVSSKIAFSRQPGCSSDQKTQFRRDMHAVIVLSAEWRRPGATRSEIAEMVRPK